MRAARRQGPSIAQAIGTLVDTHLQDRLNVDRIRELNQVASTTAALIHELQKERGLSSGLAAGAGRRFSEDLPRQTTRTDRSLAEAVEAWAAIGPDPRRGALEAALGEARSHLADLARLRTDIRALALTPNAVVLRFSSLIDRLLVVIAEVPGSSPHPQITLALIALFNFLLAKEYTGQIRALGSAVCAQGGFEPFQFEKFQSLLRQREESLDIFARHAVRNQLERWTELKTSESFLQWESRRLALEGIGREGRGALPDASDWYQWSTAAIDTMRTAEISLLDNLRDLSLHILAETRSEWENQQESPEVQEELVLHRLERTQLRLQEERRDQRVVSSLPAPDPSAEEGASLVRLANGSAEAAEELHRLRRELDRWDTVVRDGIERSRQARILSLDAGIEAIDRNHVAAGARELAHGLGALAEGLQARLAGLKATVDRSCAALEQWHGLALELRKGDLDEEEPK